MTASAGSIIQRFRAAIRHSLAARLVTIAVVSVFGLVLMGWIAHAQFNAQLLRLLIDPEIESVADDLIGNAGPGLSDELILRDLPYDPRYLQPLSGRYFQIALVRGDGRLQTQTISPSLVDAEIRLPPNVLREIAAARPGDGARYFSINGPDGGDLRIVTRLEAIPEVEGRYVFVVGVLADNFIQ